MKIAVLIPSRNRPRMLSAAITVLHEMESGENEVQYRIGCDFDEPNLQEYIDIAKSFNALTSFCSHPTIGKIWNFLTVIDPLFEADIYSCMIDDAFPITPHWDKEMVRLASQYEAFSWYEVSAPHNCGYPTCTKAWLDKVGYIVPEHFPYWFMDSWFAEMVQFVTGQGVPVSTQMALYSKQEATQGFRDLDFWWGFFNATRNVRLEEAYKIVCIKENEIHYHDFLLARKPFIYAGRERDIEFRGERIKQLEADRGVKSEPSERYLLTRKRAEEYLEKNGLKIWQ